MSDDKPAPPLRPGDRALLTMFEFAGRPNPDQTAPPETARILGAASNGWVEPRPLASPAGVSILDKMLDARDRLDREALAERLRGLEMGHDPDDLFDKLSAVSAVYSIPPARLPIGIYFHQLPTQDLVAMGPLTKLHCSIPGHRNEIDLVEQIVEFLREEVDKPDPMAGIRALQAAYRTYKVLIGVGYEHEPFLRIVETELTKLAKWARGEVVRRLLYNELDEMQATAALQMLVEVGEREIEEAVAKLVLAGVIDEREAQARLDELAEIDEGGECPRRPS